ncbi:MAG: hypothetical protein WEB06_00440 [Actinomycetota bacterium]
METARRPVRWRIAEAFESRWGWAIILAIGVLVLAAFLVPLLFRPFVGRPANKAVQQTEVRCEGALSEISRGMAFDTPDEDPRRICVERARARTLVASIAGFFVLLFTGIALFAKGGKIQPRDLAR